MNATELIVELVLTGGLALAALLLPVFACAGIEPKLSAETVALWVAVGFMLGVVIDRCADSILGRWEGFIRCAYAHNKDVATARTALVGTAPVQDAFPEGWMRVKMMSTGGEGIIKWLDQSRVRIRIARTVAILVPSLTVSALAVTSLCPRIGTKEALRPCLTAPNADQFTFLIPILHLVFLIACFACAEWWLQSPRTDQAPLEPPRARVAVLSASSFWFALELALALCFVERRAVSLAVLGLGILLATLATLTWWRLTKTFMAFVWTFCHSEHKRALARKIAP